MSRVYIDATVPLHALGGDDELRYACGELLSALGSGRLVGEASVLAINEVAHVRLRRGGDRAAAAREAEAVLALLVVHDVTVADLESGLSIFAKSPSLDMSDALHVAVARRIGVETIVTTDTDFDGLEHLQRVDPRNSAELLDGAG